MGKKLEVFEMPSTLKQAKDRICQAELLYDGVVASLERNEKRAHTQQRELDGIYEANEEAALDEYDAAQEEPKSPLVSTWRCVGSSREFVLYDGSGKAICRMSRAMAEKLTALFWIPQAEESK